MLSYQHAYHAGNQADLHKHMVLAGLLTLLTENPRPITYMETHAGRGLYDLASKEALKTGEAEFGIGSATGGDHAYFEIIDQIREKHGPSAYPGSPLVARSLLRPQDRLHLFELHPQEHAALKTNLTSPNTTVHFLDGFAGALAISPPDPRDGLVLVDPSYEVKAEYAATAAFAHKLAAVWHQASILVWYPILPANRHKTLIAELGTIDFLQDETTFPQNDGRGMLGSGLILMNPAPGAQSAIDDARAKAGDLLR